jgi:hypothetical protein
MGSLGWQQWKSWMEVSLQMMEDWTTEKNGRKSGFI